MFFLKINSIFCTAVVSVLEYWYVCWQQQHKAVLIVGEAYFIVIVKMPIDERNKGPLSENNNLASHNYDLVSQNNVLSHDWEKFLEINELQPSDNYLQPVACVTCFTGTGPLHQQHNTTHRFYTEQAVFHAVPFNPI